MAVIAAYGGTTLEYDDSVSDTSSDDAANQEANTNKFISDIQHGLSQPGFKNLATNISGIFGLPEMIFSIKKESIKPIIPTNIAIL